MNTTEKTGGHARGKTAAAIHRPNREFSQCTGSSAFTALELLFTVFALAIAAVVLLPALSRPHHHCYVSCANNLKQIGLAFKCWSLDNGDKLPMQVSVTNGGTLELVARGNVYPHFLVMSNELSTPKILWCPAETGSGRKMADSFGMPSSMPSDASPAVPLTNDLPVSYFVAVDADENNPRMLLSGDRTLSLNGAPAKPGLNNLNTNTVLAWTQPRLNHDGGGYVLHADGSVDSGHSSNLNAFRNVPQPEQNRLAFP